MKETFIRLPVIATNRHCSDDCPSIYHYPSFNGDQCQYFNTDLKRDSKRLLNANLRLKECRKARKDYEVD